MNLVDLDDDCLFEILLHLPVHSVSAAARVCKRFQCILEGELLWERFSRRDHVVPETTDVVGWRSWYRNQVQSVGCFIAIKSTDYSTLLSADRRTVGISVSRYAPLVVSAEALTTQLMKRGTGKYGWKVHILPAVQSMQCVKIGVRETIQFGADWQLTSNTNAELVCYWSLEVEGSSPLLSRAFTAGDVIGFEYDSNLGVLSARFLNGTEEEREKERTLSKERGPVTHVASGAGYDLLVYVNIEQCGGRHAEMVRIEDL